MYYYNSNKNSSFGFFLILIFLLIIIFILINVARKLEPVTSNYIESSEITETSTTKSETNIHDLIDNSSYSIVGISKLNEKNTSVFVENSEEKLGIGSGIVLSANGYILSNYATTGNIDEICYVTLKSGTVYPGSVKWVDKSLDISILKISADNLLYLEMGNSDEVSLGDKLYLLSNATGYDFNFVFQEILISKEKTTLKFFDEKNVSYAQGILKTNSEINFENNGGAVLDLNGKLIGITSSKINAIIPINKVKSILKKLQENENYKSISLGINGFDYESIPYLAPEYPLKIGIYVDNVEENSCLSGKVFQGDIIIKMDDKELISFDELMEYLIKNDTKKNFTITLLRGTKEITTFISLKQ